jgi:hypothetical protein
VLSNVPEHEIQASRFSASGRRCPLSSGQRPKQTAYASPCMFSRLERDFLLCVFTFTGGMAFRVLGYKFQKEGNFSCDYLIYFAPPRLRDAAMVYEAIRLEIEVFSF